MFLLNSFLNEVWLQTNLKGKEYNYSAQVSFELLRLNFSFLGTCCRISALSKPAQNIVDFSALLWYLVLMLSASILVRWKHAAGLVHSFWFVLVYQDGSIYIIRLCKDVQVKIGQVINFREDFQYAYQWEASLFF
jgi:hypothetical protein